ncbi:hypothetical protein [Rhodosalinus sp. 5P4]|uniref:hypothetical protein n=1 Tax=Rhodosalinus sp. 5P4 TaxID=3239196 RepID=UPI00352332C2
MSVVRPAVALLLAGALAACAPVAPQPPAGAQLRLSPSGLDVAGTGLEVGFGRTQESATDTLRDILGSPAPPQRSVACAGVQTVRWAEEGLSLHFARDAFVGWEAVPAPRPIPSASGLRAGGPAPGGAGLGPFERDGIRGLSGPDGEISRLWAGRDCPTGGVG